MCTLRKYRWSSYQSYIYKSKDLSYVEHGPVLAEMAGKRRERSKQYKAFVESGLTQDDDEFKEALKESPTSIGSDGFRVWIDELYHELVEKHDALEDISFRRTTAPLGPDVVLKILADVFGSDVGAFCRRRRNSPLRAVAARYLIRYAGQNQREVAKHLNAGTGAAISKQISRYRELLSTDRTLGKLLKKAEQLLKRQRNEMCATS